MNTKTAALVLVSLAIGALAGWFAKPEQPATNAREQRSETRKSRIAEPKTRIKTVTTVVTNTIESVITNTVVHEPPRGPEAWRAEMERLKEENPAEYAARTNRMAQFRARMLQQMENRLETLSSIDTTGWSKRQVATHEKYQELLARREELMELLRPDSGISDSQRQEAHKQMRELWQELHKTSEAERNLLLDKTFSGLGYSAADAREIRETVKTIYSTTQEWGGPGGRRPPGGGPPRR